jgi:pimeloyl-ACP methyl ester carboxylesterase
MENRSSASSDPVIRLKDGRALCFVECGDPHGKPVIFFHGQPGSRLEGMIFDETARSLGIRFITPDRPGYGRSDFKPGRTLMDWAGVIVELADHMGLEHFAVLGFSGGGPYVPVCAYLIPQRLSAAAMVSSVGSMEARGVTRGMSFPNRALIALLRIAPPLAEIPFKQMAKNLKLDPEIVFKDLVAPVSAAERACMELPEQKQHILAGLAEALRPGTRGVAHEVSLYVRPWGFHLEEIAFPVQLWQGEEDVNTPLAMGRYMAQAMPNCKPHFIPGEGHQSLLVHHRNEILQGLI